MGDDVFHLVAAEVVVGMKPDENRRAVLRQTVACVEGAIRLVKLEFRYRLQLLGNSLFATALVPESIQ